MAKRLTDEELQAKLLRQHINTPWAWDNPVILSDGPLRRALIRAGYVESYNPGIMSNNRRPRWRMTEKGWKTLIDKPGSRLRSPPRG